MRRVFHVGEGKIQKRGKLWKRWKIRKLWRNRSFWKIKKYRIKRKQGKDGRQESPLKRVKEEKEEGIPFYMPFNMLRW
jgi:hypothetical protein